jgi:ankyrin repeat protein
MADVSDVPDVPDESLVELAHQLFDLARAGQDELAAYVDAGVPVDLTDASGNTLLMLAAYHGHPGTVTVLADLGADVDRTNDRGQTPLAGAVFKGAAEVVRALLDAGADPDAGTPTARQSASLFGQDELLSGPAHEDPSTHPDSTNPVQ